MRVLFYHAPRHWSGSSRAFAAAARALHEREWEVTFVCAPQSAVEERILAGGYEVASSSMEGGWVTAAFRLRRILEDRFIEVVFVHGQREHLIAAAATRLAFACASSSASPRPASSRTFCSSIVTASPRALQRLTHPSVSAGAWAAGLGLYLWRANGAPGGEAAL